jgi:stage IV sporulation protein A
METLVLPNIQDANVRARTRDELPQSGGGRMVMTVEPKFIPDEAAELIVAEGLKVRVRLVDCVGYSVSSARGFDEEMGPRMVRTPWFDEPIPFQEAAELGTRKVIDEHSTIGVVVTTDGSVTDIPRADYVPAEERVIAELSELGKPFVVLLNSAIPTAEVTRALASDLMQRYRVAVIPCDCQNMSAGELLEVLHESLYEFPIREVNVRFSRWIDSLDDTHWLKAQAQESVFNLLGEVNRIRDLNGVIGKLQLLDFVDHIVLTSVSLGTGTATVDHHAKQALFYQVLSELTGTAVEGDYDLIRIVADYGKIKKGYDKVSQALQEVAENGYGIVTPTAEDIAFDEPELFRHGHRFGVRLKASAPSIHMIRANIMTEVMPFVGTEKQGEELLRYLSEEFEKDPSRIWNSEFLGKPVHALIEEGIQSKLHRMPDNAQLKLQETLTKIINEGSGGLICIIL